VGKEKVGTQKSACEKKSFHVAPLEEWKGSKNREGQKRISLNNTQVKRVLSTSICLSAAGKRRKKGMTEAKEKAKGMEGNKKEVKDRFARGEV